MKHWLLDQIPPAQAELALAQFGAAATWQRKRKNISQLSSLERVSAVSAGFNAIASSRDLNHFLDQLASVGKNQGVGLGSIYGTLYQWLYKSVTKSFEPLKEIVIEHYRDTQKVTKLLHIFHRRVYPKKIMSAEAAARECGCTIGTFYSVREAIEQNDLMRNQKSDQICVEVVSAVKQFLHKNISFVEAAKQLNLVIRLNVLLKNLRYLRYQAKEDFRGAILIEKNLKN